MENLSYLFAAYSIIFAAIAIYVVFIWRRQAQLDTRLRGLEVQLRELRAEIEADSPRSTPKQSR
jgi:CcmD family protein